MATEAENIAIGVGVAGALLVLIAIIIALVYWNKRKKRLARATQPLEIPYAPYQIAQPQTSPSLYVSPPLGRFETYRPQTNFLEWPQSSQYTAQYRSPYGASDSPTQIITPPTTMPLFVAQPPASSQPQFFPKFEPIQFDLPEMATVDTAQLDTFKQNFMQSWNADLDKTKERFQAVKEYDPSSFVLPAPEPVDMTLWNKFEQDFKKSWDESLAKTKETFAPMKDYDPKSFVLPGFSPAATPIQAAQQPPAPPPALPPLNPNIQQIPSIPQLPATNTLNSLGYYYLLPGQGGQPSQLVYVPGTVAPS